MRSFIMSLVCLILVPLALVGCPGDTAEVLKSRGAPEAPQGQAVAPVPYNAIDVGNGVYYFDVTRANFAHALSAFIAAHPELELVAMTGNGTTAYGADRGYFTVFRPKAR